jgi:hypothetical protein
MPTFNPESMVPTLDDSVRQVGAAYTATLLRVGDNLVQLQNVIKTHMDYHGTAAIDAAHPDLRAEFERLVQTVAELSGGKLRVPYPESAGPEKPRPVVVEGRAAAAQTQRPTAKRKR